MRDFIHDAASMIEKNRGTFVAVLVCVGCVCLGACSAFDGRVTSSTSGEILSGEELKSEYVVESNKLGERYDAAVVKLRSAEAEIEAVVRDSERLDENLEYDIAASNAELQARQDVIGQVGAALETAGVAVPWLGPLIGLGGTAFAGGVLFDNRRKDRIIRNQKSSGTVPASGVATT